MGWFHKRVERAAEAAWEGPFAPPAPSQRATFNPMVRTAAELAGHPDEAATTAAAVPAAAPASSAAA